MVVRMFKTMSTTISTATDSIRNNSKGSKNDSVGQSHTDSLALDTSTIAEEDQHLYSQHGNTNSSHSKSSLTPTAPSRGSLVSPTAFNPNSTDEQQKIWPTTAPASLATGTEQYYNHGFVSPFLSPLGHPPPSPQKINFPAASTATEDGNVMEDGRAADRFMSPRNSDMIVSPRNPPFDNDLSFPGRGPHPPRSPALYVGELACLPEKASSLLPQEVMPQSPGTPPDSPGPLPDSPGSTSPGHGFCGPMPTFVDGKIEAGPFLSYSDKRLREAAKTGTILAARALEMAQGSAACGYLCKPRDEQYYRTETERRLRRVDFKNIRLLPLGIPFGLPISSSFEKVDAAGAIKRQTGSGGAICFVVRNPCSAFCREHARALEVLAEKQTWEDFGIFGIINELGKKDEGIVEFSSEYFPRPLYLDTEGKFYEAMGNRVFGLADVIQRSWNPLQLYLIHQENQHRLDEKKIKGTEEKILCGSGIRQGGVIIFDSRGIVTHAFPENTGDELPVEDIIDAVNEVRGHRIPSTC
uniref:Thioredoxin domain-containing protein n=1 Tax=Corethron hystrix TaxID=216773 RepID=A0A7S1FM58_9STRA|mmetsp:Transcript_12925/g.28564  ORF Transcript_12925/g.28564 Transcript_12925/m.28564 type:complete len:525 (+) Transcript_12925:104-1678(+)